MSVFPCDVTVEPQHERDVVTVYADSGRSIERARFKAKMIDAYRPPSYLAGLRLNAISTLFSFSTIVLFLGPFFHVVFRVQTRLECGCP